MSYFHDEDEEHDRLREEGRRMPWQLVKVTYPTQEELNLAQTLAKLFLSIGALPGKEE